MASIIIQTPGLLTTVQDSGRYGYQRYGMPVAGAMDLFSYQLANYLVGNKPESACLETTFTGPEIIFTEPGTIAICGADMDPAVNGKSISLNKTISVNGGDRLTFSGLKNGCRSYIAFAGGLNVPLLMGSRSTYLRGKIGGFEGRALKAGDELPLGKITGKIRIKEIPGKLIPRYQSFQTIQIIPGPEIKRFEREAIQYFLTSEYKVSEQSDRMGYRLSGHPLNQQLPNTGIISSGISSGTIQIPGDGQPIILMADRQTVGGYARIANVASIDLTLIAQLKPGDCIHFREISVGKAQEIFAVRQMMHEKGYPV
jgi:biotin-dependent carboxylase-like uncharacterized protein